MSRRGGATRCRDPHRDVRKDLQVKLNLTEVVSRMRPRSQTLRPTLVVQKLKEVERVTAEPSRRSSLDSLDEARTRLAAQWRVRTTREALKNRRLPAIRIDKDGLKDRRCSLRRRHPGESASSGYRVRSGLQHPDHPGAVRIHAAHSAYGSCGRCRKHGVCDDRRADLPECHLMGPHQSSLGAGQVRRFAGLLLALLVMTACLGPKPRVQSAKVDDPKDGKAIGPSSSSQRNGVAS